VTRPLTVLVCALGGEGGGVLAEWLYGAAVRAGHAAQATSIPGVAQRTGATTYYIEIGSAPALARAAPPMFSLSPVPGGIDLLVSSELLETVRQAGAGFVARSRTLVISSAARTLTVAEKMALADGRADSAALVAALQRQAQALHLLDFTALAREAGTAISAVLLGAVAAGGRLPLPRGAYEDAIRAAGKGVGPSLAGFALAFDAMQALQRQQQREAAAFAKAAVAGPAAPSRAALSRAAPSRAAPSATAPNATATNAAAPSRRDAPAAPAERVELEPAALRVLARARVAAYQDEAYAQLFDERLARVQAAEQALALPSATSAASAASAAATRRASEEAVRWLALWMCFDDIVQVARVKLAAARLARVRREVGAAPGDIVQVYDHFKPGVPELAGVLPEDVARWLVAWERRRVAAGREPWAWPLKIGTHGVRGALALRALASAKRLRRRGQRFALEQSAIERWLAAVERGAREDAALGVELARCGALIKGYGATLERGKENLLHIIDHLAFGAGIAAPARAEAVRAARAAAQADDGGHAFDDALVAHGAAARAPREQVVRWFRRRPAVDGR
jgi:indolepyruvate ferredoxin oxidoreductase beta subunit